MGILSSCRGVVWGLIMFMFSFLDSIFIIVPLIPLAYLRPMWWRVTLNYLVGFWISFPVGLLSFLFNVDVYVSGDAVDPSENAILIMNHPTRLDWMFLWNALFKMDHKLLCTEKISLKKQLKFVPGLGWAMACGAYIFLERRWEEDEQLLEDAAEYLSGVGAGGFQILLFPEGTNMSPETLVKSNSFAKANHLPHYKHVLHPRTAGFAHLFECLLRRGGVESVYDVTVGYPGRRVVSEFELALNGVAPDKVCFHFDKYTLDDLNINRDTESAVLKEKLSKWLKEIFRKKEAHLEYFYSQNDADNKDEKTAEENFKLAQFAAVKSANHRWPAKFTVHDKVALLFSFVFWMSTGVLFIYWLIYTTWARLFLIFSAILYTAIQWYCNGIEKFFVGCFLDGREKKKKHLK